MNAGTWSPGAACQRSSVTSTPSALSRVASCLTQIPVRVVVPGVGDEGLGCRETGFRRGSFRRGGLGQLCLDGLAVVAQDELGAALLALGRPAESLGLDGERGVTIRIRA